MASKNLEHITPENIYTQDQCACLITTHLISKNGKGLSPILQRECYIIKHNLLPLYQSIKWLTARFDNIQLTERIYRVYYNILTEVKCKYCNENTVSFDKFTTGFRPFCSVSCSTSYNTPSKFLCDESKISRAKKISDKRLGMKFNEEWKLKLKAAANSLNVIQRKQQSCLIRYGTTNPGVLGAYSSKAAQNYIINLLVERCIDFNRAMFKTDGTHEFWQMIYVPFLSKKRYFSYDLVVFKTAQAAKDKDLSQIDLVFEYNGPWHYRHHQVLLHENESATPYKSNKFTKQEQYQLDQLKLDHIKQFKPKEILIYWEKENLIENISL